MHAKDEMPFRVHTAGLSTSARFPFRNPSNIHSILNLWSCDLFPPATPRVFITIIYSITICVLGAASTEIMLLTNGLTRPTDSMALILILFN